MKLLHSKIIGTGRPLVILHGFLGMGDNWKTLGNKFAADGFQVHLVDQRNHGRSFHSEDFSYSLMAQDLLHYLDYYNVQEVALIGHSMGGKTAMEFATTYPERVSSLLVADIAPKAYPQHHQDILKGLAALDFNQLASRSQADKQLSQYISEFGVRQFLLKNLYWVAKGQLGLRMNLKDLTAQIDQVGRPLDEAAIFNGDTLFLKGSKSNYIDTWDEVAIKQHFPKADVKEISNAGHWLHAENPDEFYQIVTNFL